MNCSALLAFPRIHGHHQWPHLLVRSITVPDTGQFYLLSVAGVMTAEGALLQVTHIECRCLKCHRLFAAIHDHGLIDLDGGAVLTCPDCGNRQAIARARLEDFRARAG